MDKELLLRSSQHPKCRRRTGSKRCCGAQRGNKITCSKVVLPGLALHVLRSGLTCHRHSQCLRTDRLHILV